MFILPIYRKIDWRHPPLATITLILLNCLVFFLIQADDDRDATRAVAYYLDSALPELEIPFYLQHLKATQAHSSAWALERAGVDEAQIVVQALFEMQANKDFMDKLRAGPVPRTDPRYATWHAQRVQFNHLLGEVVAYRFALHPGDPSPATLLTHMFLHADIFHLLGNMVFLFVVGYVVEQVLGARTYLLAYLGAGLCSGLLDVVVHPSSLVPSIGASGAISGVMGMYAVLFGMRRISFFYFVIVYFDFVKLPALVVLPLWIGHELVQMLWGGGGNINYLAHLGGLLGGAGIAAALKRYATRINVQFLDADAHEEQRVGRYDEAMQLLSSLQFDRAAQILEKLSAASPEDRNLRQHWYRAARHQPQSDSYHRSAHALLSLGGQDAATTRLVLDIYRDYVKTAKNAVRFNAPLLLALAARFAGAGALQESEGIVANLVRQVPDEGKLPGLILKIAEGYRRAGNVAKFRALLAVVTRRYPHSQEATHATQLFAQTDMP